MQFNDNSFGLYNMFNNYFLVEGHENRLGDFLKLKRERKNMLIFCDPPFGGLLEPLCLSLEALRKVGESHGYAVKTMLVLPYYLGKKLNEFNADLGMLDYRVSAGLDGSLLDNFGIINFTLD